MKNQEPIDCVAGMEAVGRLAEDIEADDRRSAAAVEREWFDFWRARAKLVGGLPSPGN